MDPATFLQSLLCFIIFFFTVFKILETIKGRTKLNLPPSPPKLPIIGNFHQIGKDLHTSFRSLSEKYGPVFLLSFGSSPFLVVSSAEIAKEIVASNDVFANRPQTKVVKCLFYNCSDIAFCRLGDYWRQAKKICVMELLNQKRVQAARFVREEETTKLVDKIRLVCNENQTVDLTEAFQTVSNDIIARSALGRVYQRKSCGNLTMGELSRRAMDLIGGFCVGDYFPVLGWIDDLTGLTGKIKRTSEELHDFLDQVIEEHQEQDRFSCGKTEKTDVVDILLHLQEHGMLEPNLTRENLKSLLLDMFIGGTDTTAVTMEWAMAELMKNPQIMKKAQEEVRRIVGENQVKVDETGITQMHYLKCVLKETMRLHVPTLLTRYAFEKTRLRDYDIPANTTVFVNSWAIQRDPELWEKPEEFVPERFVDAVGLDFTGQNSKYMPFGGGKRSCPGIAFAVTETEFVLANLLYWFDWELPGGLGAETLDMSDAFAVVIHKRLRLYGVPKIHSFA